MKNLKIYTLSLLALGLLLFNACTEDDPVVVIEEDDPVIMDTATYAADAAPILDASCAFSGCHAAGANIGSLEGYEDAKNFAGFGKLVGAIKHESGFSAMPKNGSKLSDADIATLEDWIADGLLE